MLPGEYADVILFQKVVMIRFLDILIYNKEQYIKKEVNISVIYFDD